MATQKNVIENSAGSVGIGTTAPTQVLELKKTTGSAIALLNYNDSVKFNINASSAGAGYVGMVSNHPLLFVNNDTERMRLDTNGNLGIGSSSPGYKLDVYTSDQTIARFAGTNSSQIIRFGNTAVTQFTDLIISADNGQGEIFRGGGTYASWGGTSALNIYNSNGPIAFHPNNTANVMFLSSAGNVGIGTNNPTALLTMFKTSFDSDADGFKFGYSSDYHHSFSSTFSSTTALNNLGININNGFNTGRTRVMTLLGNGNVGIGTSSPTAKLQVGTQMYGSAPDANYFVVGNENFTGTGPVAGITGYPVTGNRNQVTASMFDIAGGWERVNGSHALLRVSAYDVINSTPALTVLNNGNVGMGTNSPASRLQLGNLTSTQTSATEVLSLGGTYSNSAGSNVKLRVYEDGGGGAVGGMSVSAGQMEINTWSVGKIAFYRGTTQSAIIDANGNLGIGTSSPAAKLDVAGDIKVGSGTTSTTKVTGSLHVTGSITLNASRDSNWPLLISDPSTVGGSSRYQLGKVGAMGFNYADSYAQLQIIGSSGAYIDLGNSATDDLDARLIYFSNSRLQLEYGTQMAINSTGVGIGTTSPGSLLDVYSSTNGQVSVNVRNPSTGVAAYAGLAIGNNNGSNSGGIVVFGSNWNTAGLYNPNGTYVYSNQGGGLVLASEAAAPIIFGTSNTERMRILSGGNVGIGTSSPASILHLNGTAPTILTLSSTSYPSTYLSTFGVDSGARAFLIFGNNGENQIRAGRTTTGGYLDFYTNNTVGQTTLASDGNFVMRLSAGGNVGIGTTNPVYKLQVSGQTFLNNGTSNALQIQTTVADTTTRDAIYLYEDSGAATGRQAISWYNGNQSYYKARLWTEVGNNYQATQFGIDVADDTRTVATRLLIRNGNVGIGTTNPVAKLHITGSSTAAVFQGNVGIGTTSFTYSTSNRGLLELYGATDSLIALRNSNNPFYIQKYSTAAYFNNTDNGPLIIYTNNTERMRLTADGNLGIGTTSPGTKFSIIGNISSVSINAQRQYTYSAIGSTNDDIWFRSSTTFANNGAAASLNLARLTYQSAGTGNDLTDKVGIWLRGFYDNSGGGLPIYLGGYAYSSQIPAVTITALNSDGGGGSVGIGTTSPVYTIQVGTGANSATARAAFLGGYTVFENSAGTGNPSITFNNDIDTGILNPASNVIAFNTNGTEKVRITSVGNVGIGTTSVNAGLEVVNSSRMRGILRPANAPTGSFFNEAFTLANDGGAAQGYIYSSIPQTGASFPFDAYGELLIQGNPRSGYNNGVSIITGTGTNQTIKFRVQNDGNVGIGTTSPKSKLEVAGTAGTAIVSVVNTSTSRSGSFGIDSNGTYIRNSNNGDYFDLENASGTSRFRVVYDNNTFLNTTFTSVGSLTQSGSKLSVFGNTSIGASYGSTAAPSNGLIVQGNVGIGTSSPTNGTLQVYNASGNTLSLQKSGGGAALIMGSETTNYALIESINAGGIRIYTGNGTQTEKLRVQVDGNVGIGSSSPSAKLDVVDAGNLFVTRDANGYPRFTVTNGSAQLGLFRTGTNAGGFYIGGDDTLFSVWTTGFARLFNVNNSGNVGIGVSTPITKLDIASTQSDGITLRYDTTTNYRAWIRPYWNSTTDSRIDFAINRSSGATPDVIMSVGYGGNVGIGTTSPSATLTVIATNNTGSRIQLGTASTSGYMNANLVNDFMVLTAPFGASAASVSNGGAKWGIKMNGSIDNINIKSKSACIYAVSEETDTGYNRRVGLALHTSGFDLDNAERVRIKNDGNVGIGTTGPTNKLHVYMGASSATAASNAMALFEYNANGVIQVNVPDASEAGLFFGRSGAAYYTGITRNGTDLVLKNNSTTAVTINSSGNVGIGTSSPAQKLHVVGAVYGTTYGQFGTAVASGTNASFAVFGSNSAAVGVKLVLDSDVNRNDLVVATTGNIGIGTSTPGAKLNTYASGSNLSVFKVDGGNGTLFEVTDQLSGSLFSVNDVSGLPLLEVFSNNRIVAGKYNTNALVISGSSVGIGTATPAYKLQVNGSFGATTKSFIIDHPTKEGKKLVYGSLESPYHGIRLTGRNVLIDGECKVKLPDYIYKLARPESVNIQITPIKCGKVIYVDDISVENNYFTAKYDKLPTESYVNYEFFWDFTATRSDVDPLIVEQ